MYNPTISDRTRWLFNVISEHLLRLASLLQRGTLLSTVKKPTRGETAFAKKPSKKQRKQLGTDEKIKMSTNPFSYLE